MYNSGKPCYDHNTLADLLDNNTINNNAITWKYYPQGPHPGISLWTAPNAIKNICSASNDGDGNYSCGGTYWTTHVDPPPPSPQGNAMAPILTDIGNCALPNVSWVIPDGSWSDHAGLSDNGTEDGNYGPSWVAAIVNAVGNSWQNSGTGHQCDYWGGNTTGNASQPTVIIVVWDDWGGWYDHVLPWNCQSNYQGGNCLGYPQNGGGQQYVYGFRVPMLVISAYNNHAQGQSDGYTGYISGACGQSGQLTCPNEGAGLVHDFGSILNFIEYAFGTNGNLLSLSGDPKNLNKGINPTYLYADYWAPDWYQSGNCTQKQCQYSLSDFFTGNWSQTTGFTQIDAPSPASVFENWMVTATDPDDDDEESQ